MGPPGARAGSSSLSRPRRVPRPPVAAFFVFSRAAGLREALAHHVDQSPAGLDPGIGRSAQGRRRSHRGPGHVCGVNGQEGHDGPLGEHGFTAADSLAGRPRGREPSSPRRAVSPTFSRALATEMIASASRAGSEARANPMRMPANAAGRRPNATPIPATGRWIMRGRVRRPIPSQSTRVCPWPDRPSPAAGRGGPSGAGRYRPRQRPEPGRRAPDLDGSRPTMPHRRFGFARGCRGPGNSWRAAGCQAKLRRPRERQRRLRATCAPSRSRPEVRPAPSPCRPSRRRRRGSCRVGRSG